MKGRAYALKTQPEQHSVVRWSDEKSKQDEGDNHEQRKAEYPLLPC
jgi:hypothetical protein